MKYIGKLYGKIGNKYFELGKNSEDFDTLERQVKKLDFDGTEYRATIEELEKENDKFFDENEHLKRQLEKEKELSLTIKDICEAMEEYAKIEWISVNKRVDIKGGKYLVYDPNWIEDNKIRTAFYRNYNGIWIADNGSDDVIHPTHYMKLPNDPTNE